MRIQLIVSDAQYALIDDLKKKTGAVTIREVLNNALTLFDWAVRETIEGASICAIDDRKDIRKELQMHALSCAAHAKAEFGKDVQTATASKPTTAKAAAKGVGA